MELTSAQIFTWIGGLFWPFIRLGAMLLASPVLGARMIPVRIRIVLALVMAWLIAPLLPPVPAVDPLSPAGILITAQQVLIGVSMGFVLQMVFGAVVMAGQNIAMSMGLGFASALDPQNGVQVPVLSQFYMVITTLVFLALDGQLVIIETLVQSFYLLPVGSAALSSDFIWQVVSWGSFMFVGSVLMAVPVMVSLLLVNLAFGVMTRASPQLNIFAVGFPVTLLAGFVLLLFSLPALLPQLVSLFADAFANLQDMLAMEAARGP
ncbi:flagellar biosynthetic protein FliR [bacterium SCSIO 12696]|nr:flagellar biosynthetic protein FliR [bacterium SCSIO 12696]